MSDPDGPVEETPRRYRNPPIEHRFRKGVSGNPRGEYCRKRPSKLFKNLIPTLLHKRNSK